MWLCFNDAFVSVVRDLKDPHGIMIRSRRREHLKRLFPDADIIEGAGTDYKYRVFVDEQVIADLVRDRILGLDYGNFKNSVREEGLHDLYTDFWELHYEYQR